MANRCVLLVLDGWGIGRRDLSNPIHAAKAETIKYIRENYPSAALEANGMAVGLPWKGVGNSRVGHLSIGAGRIIYQNYPKISLSIREGHFYENPKLLAAIEHAKENKSALQVVGLLGEGHVHSSIDHIGAMLELAKRQDFHNLYLHLIADGKDSAPRSLKKLLAQVEEMIKAKGVGKIASLIGRYYALDKHGNWERTQKTYETMTSAEPSSKTLEEVLNGVYERGGADDFFPGFVFPEVKAISANDSVVFINFQEDGIRQLVGAFALKNFDKFPKQSLENLFLVGFIKYSDIFDMETVFEQEKIKHPLGEVLAEQEKAQMLVAETINYASVSYFFNALREEAFNGQFMISIPSNKNASQVEKPEMKAEEIADRVVQAVDEHSYDFIFANFANADVVAQTGNFEATVKAIQAIDEQLGKIVRTCEAAETTLIITSAHGNAERLFNPVTGDVETKFDADPVPLFLVAPKFKKDAPSAPAREQVIGILPDIAPTILEIMGIEKPSEMTGKSLLRFL